MEDSENDSEELVWSEEVEGTVIHGLNWKQPRGFYNRQTLVSNGTDSGEKK